MQKTLKLAGLVTAVIVLFTAVAVPATTNAEHGGDDQQQSKTKELKARAEEERQKAEDRAQTVKDDAQERADSARQKADDAKKNATARLGDTKLKVCKKREQNVTNIMKRMGDRGEKQINVFTKIADRTKNFYQEKGYALANYDALVAEANAKREAAVAANSVVKNTSLNFKCDGDNPKGVASSFKELMKNQNEAIKAYKTAVKNLIVAVKSANTEGAQS